MFCRRVVSFIKISKQHFQNDTKGKYSSEIKLEYDEPNKGDNMLLVLWYERKDNDL